jgi:hypothetical protein
MNKGVPKEATRYILEELFDGISDEVSISILLSEMGLKGRVVGKGLGLALKNAFKYA